MSCKVDDWRNTIILAHCWIHQWSVVCCVWWWWEKALPNQLHVLLVPRGLNLRMNFLHTQLRHLTVVVVVFFVAVATEREERQRRPERGRAESVSSPLSSTIMHTHTHTHHPEQHHRTHSHCTSTHSPRISITFQYTTIVSGQFFVFIQCYQKCRRIPQRFASWGQWLLASRFLRPLQEKSSETK